MPPADILKLLRERPFVPFRIHLSDGRSFEVRHPDLMMLSVGAALVGTPDPQNEGLYSTYEVIALRHVTSLEPLPTAPAA